MIALLLASCSSAISPSRYAELGVVRVVSSPPSAPPVGPPESALAVSHRESVLGCHSFDRFLHPRWETFFLFQREFAQAWRLEQLVMSAASRTSRGAHLVEFLRLPPQMAAQLLVLQLLSERDAAPETLVACSCDVHALPTWHAQHTPFRVLVERLHGALLVDTASRQSRDGSRAEHFGLADLRRWNAHIKQSDTCMRRFEKERRKPLLAACALLIETLPANDTLVGARLHGGDPDVGGWSQRGGHSGYRPSDLPEGEQWLMDSSMWLPDRFCAYNASLLAPELERMRFVSGTLVDAPRTWSAIVCSSRLGAVRSNDVIGLVESSLHNTYAPLASSAPGWSLGQYALRALAAQAAPHVCLEQLAQLRMHAGLELDHWCRDAGALLRADHLPGPELDRAAWARWLGAPAVDGSAPMGVTVGEALHPLLAPLLELAGWRLARVNVSHAVFAHLPSFGSRSLVALRGDHHMPRGHAVPWLRTSRENGQQPGEGEESCLADSGPSTTVFAGSRLGASAPFLLFALGRSEPPLLALELGAKILRVEAPLPLHLARGERVRASVWLRLAALYCNVARLLEAPARGASPEQSAYADGLRVLEPLAASWCAANGTFRRVMTTR